MYTQGNILCFFFAVMLARYLPDGPQNGVQTHNVEGYGWEECYRQNLNDYISDSLIDNTIKTNCFKDKVMMTCKETESSKFEVLAWSPKEDVFGITDDVGCGANREESISSTTRLTCSQKQCQRGYCSSGCCMQRAYQRCTECSCASWGDDTCEGHVAEGVRWYRTAGNGEEKGTWGFADSVINLLWVDIWGNDEYRLSLHVNENGVWQGAHRCGKTVASYNTVDQAGSGGGLSDDGINYIGFDDDGKWELVFYHAL